MRHWMKRVSVWMWVVWASRRRTPHDGERGSQSLEWVGLGAVVMAIMTAAYKAVHDGGLGAGIGQALTNFIQKNIPQ